ncbi:hypothetical protein ABMA27_001299 [Loxostege sticticalis]|uniref:FLYWCH-type domain-containing protein n=1 Tax=Loxostege sticticalis TaxID=481309 RepID=A0ABR3HXZ8_LOXSC
MIVNALIRHNHPFDKDVLLENGLYEKDSNDASTAVNLGKARCITTVRGSKFVIFDRYAFRFQRSMMNGLRRHPCSKAGCLSYLHVDKKFMVTAAFLNHKHLPTKYVKMKNGRYETNFITDDGKTRVLFKDFLYKKASLSMDGVYRYVCKGYPRNKCKANLRVDQNNTIIFARTNHSGGNHRGCKHGGPLSI